MTWPLETLEILQLSARILVSVMMFLGAVGKITSLRWQP
jgi:hypothetical protein